MIAYTIAQAATRVFVDVPTIQAWITAGHLTAIRNPIDGQHYIEETHLLLVERAQRHATTNKLTSDNTNDTDDQPSTHLVTTAVLRQWLWDHGIAISERGLQNWNAQGIIKPVIPSRGGRGHSALWNPHDVYAVAVARSMHLDVQPVAPHPA